MPDLRNSEIVGSSRFRFGLGLLVFFVVAMYLLWDEHEAHILGYLPLILILGLCVGMHFFMHGGHGKHRHDHDEDQTPPGRGG